MKITPRNIMSMYKAISELTNCILPYKVARDIKRLQRGITEEFETILSTEKKLVAKYCGTYTQEGIQFKDEESANLFYMEYQSLMTQEVEVDFPTVNVSTCTKNIYMSASSMDALEGVVDFGEV